MKVKTMVEIGSVEVEVYIDGADAVRAIDGGDHEGYDKTDLLCRILSNLKHFLDALPDSNIAAVPPIVLEKLCLFLEEQARRFRKIYGGASLLLLCLLLAGAALAQPPAVVTRAYDNARSGAQTHEMVLSAGAVGTRGMARLTTVPVCCDARGMEAEPLIAPGVRMVDGSTHDVLLLATMTNEVRAVDAETGAGLWTTELGTPVKSSAAIDFHQINDEWGILSTPALDAEAGVLYPVALLSPDGTAARAMQWIYALNVRDGSLAAPPVSLATVTDGNQRWGDTLRKQRSSLLLTNVGGVKTVFFASGSVMETATGSAGWVVAYDVATHRIAAAKAMSRGEGAGIWMAGQGLAADADGLLYGITGNGSYNGATDFGEAVVKLRYTPPVAGRAATLDVDNSWAPFSDAGRVGLNPTLSAPPKDMPGDMTAAMKGKLAGVSAPSERVRLTEFSPPMPVGAGMEVNLTQTRTRTVQSSDERGLPVSLIYPKNPTDPAWSDEDFGSAGGTLIAEYGVYLAAGKDGIGYPVNAADLGHTQPADFHNTHANCAKLKAPPVWIAAYVAGVDPCAQDERLLNFMPGGKTRHVHATPVQYRSPTRGMEVFVWGENSTLHAWTMAPNGTLNYLAQGDTTASANVTNPPGGMPGGFCSLSSDGNKAGSAVLWCSVPYGDANATVTQGRLLAYDPENLRHNPGDGSWTVPVLWDSERWGVSYVFNKFAAPVVWNGRVYLPNYAGGVDVYGLAGGK